MAALLSVSDLKFQLLGGIAEHRGKWKWNGLPGKSPPEPVKAIKGLKPLTYKESLGQLEPLVLKRLMGILSVWRNVWQEGANKTELDLSQWCPVKLQAQSCSSVGFAQGPSASTHSLYFSLAFADYFAARHRAEPLWVMFPLYQTNFEFPIKSHELGFTTMKFQ